jgi:phenylacetate-CoA ligase
VPDYILRYGVFPILDAVTGCLRHYRYLKDLQWDRERLQDWQDQRLRKLVSHACSTVPFYRNAYHAKAVRPFDFRGSADLPKLPIITKNDMISGFPEGTLSNTISHSRMRLSSTSGLTGRVFRFYDDKSIRGYVLASRLLFESWLGMTFGDRTVKLTTWDFPKLRTRLIGEARIPPRRLDVDPEAAVRLLRSFQPASLLGNVSIVSSLANRILGAGVDADMGLRGIVTTGEMLLSNHRYQIERAFNCPLFDRYGLAEVAGYVAQQCELRQGLHLNNGLALVEVLKDGEVCGPGETGRIVVTNLHNYVMPFIRYDTGDLGTVGDECPCGRAFPILARIRGRSANFVLTKSLPVSLTLFVGALETLAIRSIEQLQFIQTKIGELRLLLSPKLALTTGQVDEVSKWMNSVHPLVKVVVETTDSFDLSSEKHAIFKPLGSDNAGGSADPVRAGDFDREGGSESCLI